MLGWIHNCAKTLTIRYYGIETWRRALIMSDINETKEYESYANYEDSETFRIIRSLSKILEISSDEIYEILGTWVVKYALETGWDKLLSCMAYTLHEFLDNLNSMHYFIDQIAFKSELRGPLFKCEPNSDGTLRLHYYSMRNGLFPMVKGLVWQSAVSLFNIKVKVSVVERNQEKRNNMITEHVVFNIESVENNVALVRDYSSIYRLIHKDVSNIRPPPGITVQLFAKMFPFHICFNKQMIIEHCGEFLQNELSLNKRKMIKLTEIFHLVQPEDVQLSFKGIVLCLNSLFIFQLKNTLARNKKISDKNYRPLSLKGQMVLVNNGQNLLFVASFNLTTIRGLIDTNVYVSDMKMHDVTRDLILLNQSRVCQQELNKKLEETVKEMKNLAEELEAKKKQTDHLLFECIPPEIAQQLRETHTVPSQEFSEATCMMIDIPYFPIINSQCEPRDIIELMTDLFHMYDMLIDKHGCYKVLSIMDCYFVIAGVPKYVPDHVDRILNLAIGLTMKVKQLKVPKLNIPILLRIAIHSGPVVAGVLGKTKIRYGVIGETVNITKRMLIHSESGKILVTNSAKIYASKSTDNNYEFTTKGYINIGNKQATCTYYLQKNTRKSVWELSLCDKKESNTNDGYRELHLISDIELWNNLDSNIKKQQKVIEAMQNKNHFAVATDKIKKMRETFKRHNQSNDSGVSNGSGNEISSICNIM